ncbi:MAG: hypothetical protein ACRYGB_15040 [Janthinobacterium lividum]
MIGAFSTFRLQNINREVNLLKDIVIHKRTPGGQAVIDFMKNDDYTLLEKIYDRNLSGAQLLKQIITDHGLDHDLNELLIDTNNITKNQQLHDRIKLLTIQGFSKSLLFVFFSLLLLISTNILLSLTTFLWFILIFYLVLTGYIFLLFINQLKKLID